MKCFFSSGKNIVHQISVTLDDLYNGATRKLSVQKNTICERCEGTSSAVQLHALYHFYVLFVKCLSLESKQAMKRLFVLKQNALL